MAVPELHFFAANDVNGATILEVPVTEEYVERIVARPALRELGYMAFRFSRQVGFAIFDSGAFQPETFVRLLVPDVSTTRYLWGCFLNDRVQQLVARVKAGENFDFGGPGPKHYLSRAILWDEQFFGTGYNIDLANGVYRWKETASAGRVLTSLINDDANNTIAQFLPDLTPSFGNSVDSNGDPWTNDIAGTDEFELRIGDDFLTDLFKIEDSGDLETTMNLGTVAAPTLELEAWQAYGRDLSGPIGAATVHFKEAVNILGDLTAAGASQRKASHVLVEGLEDAYGHAVRTAWDPGEYAKAVGISHDTTKNENVLDRYGLAWLRRQANNENEILVPHYPGFNQAAGLYFPGEDTTSGHYWLGDTVSLTTGGDSGGTWTPMDYRSEDQRVMAITMEMRSVVKDGSSTEAALSWNVIAELNVERGSDAVPEASAGEGANGMGCHCPALCHPAEEDDPDTVEKFYTAETGSDALGWTGSNIAAGSGDGAAGTDNYYFKSGSPNEYQTSWAAAAGAQYSVTGYIGCSAKGFLKLAFTTAAAGSLGPVVGAGLISEEIITPAQPGHEHSPEWTAFSAGPFTAPVGTNSAALGRNVGADFDQVSIILVGTGSGNPYAGTDSRAARCDHVHPASDIVFVPYGTVQADNVQDAIEELADESASSVHNHSAELTTYDPTDSSLIAGNVQGAIDELDARVDDLEEGVGYVLSYVETVGDGAATSFNVTHGLGTTGIVVELWDLSGSLPVQVFASIEVLDDDTITVDTDPTVIGTSSLRVVVHGAPGVSSGGGGGAFAPSDISELGLWLDADDDATISFGSGAAVATWADKSGAGRNMTQATAANQPTRVDAEVNGRSVIRFDGTNDRLELASGNLDLLRNLSGATLFVVNRVDDTTDVKTLFWASIGGSNNSRARLQKGASALYEIGGRRLDADALDDMATPPSYSSGVVVIDQVDYDWADSAIYHYVDGTLSDSDTGWLTNGSTSDTNSQFISVGRGSVGGSPDEFMDGDVCEVVLFQRVISATERGQMTTYLSDKWLGGNDINVEWAWVGAIEDE